MAGHVPFQFEGIRYSTVLFFSHLTPMEGIPRKSVESLYIHILVGTSEQTFQILLIVILNTSCFYHVTVLLTWTHAYGQTYTSTQVDRDTHGFMETISGNQI